jgi:lipopolysaccharide export system protein LptA
LPSLDNSYRFSMLPIFENPVKWYFMRAKIIFLFLFGFLAVNLSAQQPVPAPDAAANAFQNTVDTNRVQILNARVGEYIIVKDEQVKKFKGDVRLKHKDAILYCDSAIIDASDNIFARGKVIIRQGDSVQIFSDSLTYKGFSRNADLFGNVVLVHGTKQLFTQKLNYDLARKIATYTTKATMTNGTTKLTSRRGQYFVQANEAFFKDQVVVVDKDFSLKTDTLKFNTQSNVATFLAPTRILQDSAQIYTEGGFYDLTNNNADLSPSPQYVKGLQIATADTIRYDGATKILNLMGRARIEEGTRKATAQRIRYNRLTDESWLDGKAHFTDEKQDIVADSIQYNGKTKVYGTRGRSKIANDNQILEADFVESKDSFSVARGRVFWQDTSSKTTITATQITFNQRTDYIKASGNRPILTTLIEADTLWLRADTIVTFKANKNDSARTMLAFYKVRMFKTNFQSVCDSLSFETPLFGQIRRNFRQTRCGWR